MLRLSPRLGVGQSVHVERCRAWRGDGWSIRRPGAGRLGGLVVVLPAGLASDRSSDVNRSSTPSAWHTRYLSLPTFRSTKTPASASLFTAAPVLTGDRPMSVEADATVTMRGSPVLPSRPHEVAPRPHQDEQVTARNSLPKCWSPTNCHPQLPRRNAPCGNRNRRIRLSRSTTGHLPDLVFGRISDSETLDGHERAADNPTVPDASRLWP